MWWPTDRAIKTSFLITWMTGVNDRDQSWMTSTRFWLLYDPFPLCQHNIHWHYQHSNITEGSKLLQNLNRKWKSHENLFSKKGAHCHVSLYLRPYFVDVIYTWPRGENHFFMQLTVQTDFEEISKNKIIHEKSVWNNRNSSILF